MSLTALAASLILFTACAASAGKPGGPSTTGIVITERSQRAAAVDQEVTIIGVQTRTKLPQVNGVDVDGHYDLSDKKVIVRGILKEDVVTEVDPMTANRGTGTFYHVVDPATGQLAKTQAYEE